MPNTNPCPTCHAQLDPGTPHTVCARTKEPKARELDDKINDLAGQVDDLKTRRDTTEMRVASVEFRLDGLEERLTTLTSRVDGLVSDVTKGFNASASRLEALERKTAEPVTFSRVKKDIESYCTDPYERTSAITDAIRGTPGCAPSATWMSVRAKENTEHGGGGSVRHETADMASPPAASALPMPERPRWLEHYVAPRDMHVLTNGDRERLRDACRYALALESRLAEASKSVWPVTDLNTEEECVTVLRMFGNPQASRVADVLEGITASRDALKAKLAEAHAEIRKQTAQLADFGSDLIKYQEDERKRRGMVRVYDRLADAMRMEPSGSSIFAGIDVATLQADRDALKEKLAEAEKERDESDATLELIMAANQRAVDRWRAQDPEGRKLTLPDLADHLVWTFEQLGTLQDVERDRDALRAKLDGVREAAEKWTLDDHAKDEYMKGRTVEDSLNAIGRAAITSALAAAENTNTGDAIRAASKEAS